MIKSLKETQTLWGIVLYQAKKVFRVITAKLLTFCVSCGKQNIHLKITLYCDKIYYIMEAILIWQKNNSKQNQKNFWT